MRESRSSGSVEGVMGDHDSYSDHPNMSYSRYPEKGKKSSEGFRRQESKPQLPHRPLKRPRRQVRVAPGALKIPVPAQLSHDVEVLAETSAPAKA